MSMPADQMELREEDIRKHYAAAAAMLEGFDYTPRIARPAETRGPAAPGRGAARRR